PLQRDVFRGLRELEGRIAHCPLDGAALFVTLESLEGTVRIAETRLEPVDGDPASEPAGSSVDEDAARCVRSAVEGVVFGAPNAKPGRRWEMPWAPGAAP
ncbi:MAG TPA: hypothetical protein VD838_22350, partial [Anaeromyxobacteraceae bacterium]|nr:hypothetical protein [Anaeromyxobacteraceae bacterium]